MLALKILIVADAMWQIWQGRLTVAGRISSHSFEFQSWTFHSLSVTVCTAIASWLCTRTCYSDYQHHRASTTSWKLSICLLNGIPLQSQGAASVTSVVIIIIISHCNNTTHSICGVVTGWETSPNWRGGNTAAVAYAQT